MILGKFVEGRVVLPVNFYIDESTDMKIDCVVDTGFNDYLTLPPQRVFEKYSLALVSSRESPLAPLKKGGTGLLVPLLKGDLGGFLT
jgi:predicted aspartyl protease